MNPSETILVVDDEVFLRMNLRCLLEDLGFKVLEAADGTEALVVCNSRRPDLVLLDINMPGMNGYEICTRLKGDPATSSIPVLIITAQQETSDKVKAFAAGAVDYVTKPFQFEEVEARVRTQLELHRQRREVMAQFDALCRLESLRDSFTHMVAHDMRGPLSGILASLELSLAELPAEAPGLKRKLKLAHAGAVQLSTLITQMLELSRMESGNMPLMPSRCDVTALVLAAMEAAEATRGRRRLTLDVPGPVQAWCDPAIVVRVLENLLGNALKFTGDDGLVELAVAQEGNQVRITVNDDGPGIAPEHRQRVFEKFPPGPPRGARPRGRPGAGLLQVRSDGPQGRDRGGQPSGQGLRHLVHPSLRA